MIEHWLSAFNFDAGSNYLPNPGFEASSYWASSGAESSFAYTTSQAWLGSKAGAWTITPAANQATVFSWSVNSLFDPGGGITTGTIAELFDGFLPNSPSETSRMWECGAPAYNMWDVADITSRTWIKAFCSSLQVINAFRIWFYNPGWTNAWPKRIAMYGSSTGSFGVGNRILLYETPIETSWPNRSWKSWSCSNQNAYQHFMLMFDPNITQWLLPGELELFHYNINGRVEGSFTSSNYIYVSSIPGPFYPGSAYDLGCWAMAGQDGASLMLEAIDPTSGGIVGSTPVSGVPRGGWVQFAGVFSVSVVRPALHLKITYVGPGYDNTLYIDEAYLGDTKRYDLLGAVQIFPEWELRAGMKKTTTSIRTNLGKLYTYKWGQFKRFEVPVRYISTSKAAIVNSWWQTADLLHWKVYSGGVWETNSVMIVNKTAPFNDFEKGYMSLMKGNLELETT
jgi:hypothetical protein